MQFPAIVGHEASGVVESVGQGVLSVGPGDHVLPSCVPQCRQCEFCRSPESNLCEHFQFGRDAIHPQAMLDGTTRFTCRGQPVHHFMRCSTFSEYTVCTESSVCKINPTAPLEKAVVLGCGLSTGYGTPLNVCPVRRGSSVGVWGLGAIGLGVMLGCREAGAQHIVAVDPDPKRLKLGDQFSGKLQIWHRAFEFSAAQFGATELLDPGAEYEGKRVPEYLRAKYGGGLEFAFEASGNHLAMRQAFESTKKGIGQTAVHGVTDKEVSIPADMLLMGRTIRGAVYGGWKCRDALPMLVEKALKGDTP